jgi:GMP synthase-like glutamine amidotransferase
VTGVVVLQHLEHEPAGVLTDALAAGGHRAGVRRLWRGDAVPGSTARLAAVVVLGGDMNTDEEDAHPFLADERRLLGRCVADGVPVLGTCLGAQLLAEATGGSVAHGVPQLGYLPVDVTSAGRDDAVIGGWSAGAPAFSGQRDQITAGPDAVVLATGAATPVEAFRVGDRAYGVLVPPRVRRGPGRDLRRRPRRPRLPARGRLRPRRARRRGPSARLGPSAPR